MDLRLAAEHEERRLMARAEIEPYEDVKSPTFAPKKMARKFDFVLKNLHYNCVLLVVFC